METADTVLQLGKALNVVCHLVRDADNLYSNLTLFVDVAKPVAGAKIATCDDERVSDLPVYVTLHVIKLGLLSSAESMLEKINQHVQRRHAAPSAVRMSVDNMLLRFDVDISEFPLRTQGAPADSRVDLLALSERIIGVCSIVMTMHAAGGARWPAAAATRGNDASAMTPVSRRLEYDVAAVPATSERPSSSLPETSVEDERMVVVNAALTVNTSHRRDVRLVFHPKAMGGNVYVANVTIYGTVALQLRVERRKTAALLAPRSRPAAAAGSARGGNVTVYKKRSARTGEELLVLRFSAEYTEAARPSATPASPRTGRAANRASLTRLHSNVTSRSELEPGVLAQCKKQQVDAFVVDFVALRTQLQLPSEAEIYVAVEQEMDALLGSELPSAAQLDLQHLRTVIESRYAWLKYANMAEMQELYQRVWGCAREYVLHRLLKQDEAAPRDAPSMDDAIHNILSV